MLTRERYKKGKWLFARLLNTKVLVATLALEWLKQQLSDQDVHLLECTSNIEEEEVLTLLESMQCKEGSEQYQKKKLDRCFKCGRAGHLARNCWKTSDETEKKEMPTKQEEKRETALKITCYGCGEQGYYKCNCPNNKKDKTKQNVLRAGSPGKEKDVLTLPGEVDGVECKLILDSGADISVFPLEQVIVQFGQTRRELPTAEVEIRVGGITRKETVALIAGEEINNKCLLALRLTRDEDLHLVDQAWEARIEVMCRRVETTEMRGRES